MLGSPANARRSLLWFKAIDDWLLVMDHEVGGCEAQLLDRGRRTHGSYEVLVETLMELWVN